MTTNPPSPMRHQRKIKTGSLYYDYQPLSHKQSHQGPVTVPWLQLKGKWLAQAGFSINSQVTVSVGKDCLLLTVDKKTKAKVNH
ncbi:MAG: SymE family type I addiction module toxin [Pseudomonadales bacterium]